MYLLLMKPEETRKCVVIAMVCICAELVVPLTLCGKYLYWLILDEVVILLHNAVDTE
jgi:hypothetical protein